MSPKAHVDLETRSAVDLKKTGVYVYAEHPSTSPWCLAWAIGDEPVELWTPDTSPPSKLAFWIESGGTLVAHNAAFERIIWKHILTPRYGFPEPDLEQWRCTMAMGLAMALPGDLGRLGQALQVEHQKDEAGGRLMLQMARPRSDKGGQLTWWDTEEKLERLYAYCRQDVEAERAIEKRLRPLSDFEQKLWWLDQRINDRGIAVDLDLCRKSNRIVDKLKEDLDARMSKLTEFDVTSCTNTAQFAAWLRSKGIKTGSVAKDVLADLLLDAELDPVVRDAIRVRQEGAKAATSKIDALVRGTSSDKRSKGLLQYHATVTGRWGGRRFQPQNLKRPKNKDSATLVKALQTGDAEMFCMLYSDGLSAVGDAIRSMIICERDSKLVASDFSNIEGRVAAWYAGEDWKLKAFRAFDAKTGPDLYKLAYSKSFGVPVESVGDDSNERQIGKVEELSLQYEGSHGAFVAMGANYGVDPDKIAPIIIAATPKEVFESALKRYVPANSFGMRKETWAAIRVLVDGWRAAHPCIKQSWRDLENAVISAVEHPGATFSVGSVKIKKKGSFLLMQLPSGRLVYFPFPKVKLKEMPWDGPPEWVACPSLEEAHFLYGLDVQYNAKTKAALVVTKAKKPQLHYMALDSMTNQWVETSAYGGQIFNYVVQGTARDFMAEAMFRVEAAGYPIILTTHDEILSEPKKDHGSLDEFKKLMGQVPLWAPGCPISSSGWTGDRLRKG